MARESFAEQVIATIAGAARMAAVGGGDVVRLTSTPDDWLDGWDPDYIRTTLPALRAMSSSTSAARSAAWRTSRRTGPVLLVGNHSGGTLIADTFVFAQAFYDHFGPSGAFHQLAHDLVFQAAGRAREALALRHRAGVAGEHARGRSSATPRCSSTRAATTRPTGPRWESAEIDFAGRTGFVRLALEHGVPIVPVVAIGGQETALFLGQGRRIAKLLRLDSLLRLKVFPVQVAPPFGVTVLDLPGRIPLPSKITVRVLPPIDLRESSATRSGRRLRARHRRRCSARSTGSTTSAASRSSADAVA